MAGDVQGQARHGAFRVLKTRGRLSGGFHWLDDRTETHRDSLEAEGVPFGATGHADLSRELTTEDLAWMLRDGNEIPEEWIASGLASTSGRAA